MSVVRGVARAHAARVIELLRPVVGDERFARVSRMVDARAAGVIVALDGLYDRSNVLAAMRTVEGMGVAAVDVIANRGPPLYRRKRESGAAKGAMQWLDVRNFRDGDAAVTQWSQEQAVVLSATLSPRAVPLGELVAALPRDRRLVFVFGNESSGISAPVLAGSAREFVLPMRGMTQSYNVSVAVGIALAYLDSAGALSRRLQGADREATLATVLARTTEHAPALLRKAGLADEAGLYAAAADG